MRYARFEVLVLAAGALAVFGSVLFPASGPPVAQEIIAQALLFAVLAAAVYGGRNVGAAAAIVSSTLYLVLRAPLFISDVGIDLAPIGMLAVRIAGYLFVGVVGGIVCDRLRTVLDESRDNEGFDPWSRSYNQKLVTRAIEGAMGETERYDTVFSVLTLRIAPAIFDGMRSTRKRSLVRSIAEHISGDIRLVDVLGRVDDGSFVVVLPHTPAEGAAVVADRLRSSVTELVGAQPGNIETAALSVPADTGQISQMLERLRTRDSD
ncbi:MAG: hypothetical protein Q8M66_09205 [Actinomycetota bacterium]|nr:hypothetical protein [Actinomycetota bacterium]